MRKIRKLLVASLAFAAPLPTSLAFAQSAPAAPASSSPVELTTLKLMLQKGLISQAEYDSAVRDLTESAGSGAGDKGTVVLGKWATTFYGFVEADSIYDSTQSFTEVAGNNQVQRSPTAPLPGSTGTRYAGEHGRTQFSVRNSRFGFRLKAPELGSVRTSATLELDLLGNQPAVSESAFYTSPTARVRHANLKIETPIVDVLVGQYWHLFGWQSVYHPNTVEIQGVPGELYSRTPQIRVMRKFEFGKMQLEIAGAAMRPPQRDGEVPEFQGGLRFAFNGWNGMTTAGSTGTALMPLSIAVTGDYRNFNVNELSLTPTRAVSKSTSAIAIDAFVPVLAATKESKGNALSLNGEFASGYGISDMYSGMTLGVTNPSIPGSGAAGAVPYVANVDPNLVVFDPYVANQSALHGIQLTTYLFGIQYYLPGLDGRYWVSANYAHIESNNAKNFVRYTVAADPLQSQYAYAGLVRESEDWWDVNLFGDITQGVRLGLEYANFNDRYQDGIRAVNHRVQASGFFIF